MSDIALHIGYLMSEHDCVIVPGWGAFIAQYTSAFSFYDSGLYKKPKRFVAFNSSINHSDGLLQNSLMRREGISYEAANRELPISWLRFINNLIMKVWWQLVGLASLRKMTM